MNVGPNHNPQRESPSLSDGAPLSPSPERTSRLVVSASSTPSVPANVGEALELVRSAVAARVQKMAKTSHTRLPEAPSHYKDQHLWAQDYPSQPEERLPWAWKQVKACQRAAASLVLEGNLVLVRGTLHQAMEAHQWSEGEMKNQRLVEIKGGSSWVEGSLRQACHSMTWWMEEDFLELQEAWPRDLDLGSLWLTGASDLAGDQLLLVQGTREQVMAASQGLFPARSVGGRESLIVANTMAQQLRPLEAAILVPWALETDALFYLFAG